MKRIAISIVLNGEHHLKNQIFDSYIFDEWIFVEGASQNTFCTSWCNSIPSEYHTNGTSVDNTIKVLEEYQEYYSKTSDKKITILRPSGLWNGKLEMFNTALATIKEPCYLWEVDIDEYWDPYQIINAEKLMENTKADSASFACNYLLTDQIIVRGEWGESPGHGYRRLWKFQPGMKFLSHEPPVLEGCTRILSPFLTPRFEHLSYYYEKDVIFKSKWYGKHEKIHEGWKNIVKGRQVLPCKVSALFLREDLPKDWSESIITYR